jgi:hypothetical protein
MCHCPVQTSIPGYLIIKRKPAHLAHIGGQIVQLKAVAYLDVPARLLSNQRTVHLGGLVVLSLRSTWREI